jgi:DNA-binding NtrC family response regulator
MMSLAEQLLVGDSPPMRHLRSMIAMAAPARLSVLIEGPTGSGKELVARALHEQSRRAGRFVAFNVCAIGDSMFEDALFGHVRGAYTGSVGDAPGFLLEADGGTAFFDEISGLHPSLQAKLLRAIETGEFRPLGAKKDARSDFRVIAATNERLAELVALQRFRADLAHRLSGVVLRVPSLDERREDIGALVAHFLANAGRAEVSVTRGAIRKLEACPWPGNVRELKQVVEWVVVFARGEITEEVLDTSLTLRGSVGHGAVSIGQEALRLRDSLERNSWDVERVASEFGVHVATIYRRIKRHRVLTRPPGSRQGTSVTAKAM